jgi:hypothetical protein
MVSDPRRQVDSISTRCRTERSGPRTACPFSSVSFLLRVIPAQCVSFLLLLWARSGTGRPRRGRAVRTAAHQPAEGWPGHAERAGQACRRGGLSKVVHRWYTWGILTPGRSALQLDLFVVAGGRSLWPV